MRRARYVLTARAAADLHEARVWSRARWGKELTSQYFEDLHKGAHAPIRRELTDVRTRIEQGEFPWPAQSAKSRRKK